MKPLRGNYQLGWSRCNTRRTQNDQDLTPSRTKAGLDASDNIHVSVERREKFFFLTSPLIGLLTNRSISFTAVTRVQIPSGTPSLFTELRVIAEMFVGTKKTPLNYPGCFPTPIQEIAIMAGPLPAWPPQLSRMFCEISETRRGKEVDRATQLASTCLDPIK